MEQWKNKESFMDYYKLSLLNSNHLRKEFGVYLSSGVLSNFENMDSLLNWIYATLVE